MNGNRVGAGPRERLYASTTATYDEAADLDYIAIEYALNGQPVRLTTAEKMHAARILHGHGHDDTTIGKRIHIDRSTVTAWRENGWKAGARKRKPQPRSTPVCGEPRMYRRHLQAGESCEVCRAANAAADRRYRLTGSRAAA
jgi:hypothetical protein